MVNLLPNEGIVEMRKIYRRKLFSFVLVLALVVEVSSIVFLLPSYLATRANLAGAKESLLAAQARPVSKQAEAFSGVAKAVNQKIKIVSADDEKSSTSEILSR